MLIRDAEIFGGKRCDVRIEGARIAEIGELRARPRESVIEAFGGALLSGLHDHHIHLAALAAQNSSVQCGSPQVTNADALARALQVPGTGWLRAIGFHESVLDDALPDAAILDRIVPDRPLRLQHRTGRMWLLNSRALEELLAIAAPPPGLERSGSGFTGRLFDEDAWLQRALGSLPPDFREVSAELTRFGVTGVTDMSPRNDPVIARHFAQQRAEGTLLQSPVLAGGLTLVEAEQAGWHLGPLKMHLHEAALPDFEEALGFIAAGHAQRRAVAVHCVTEVELVFTLALLECAGSMPGDRIEHVSVASPELVKRMAALGLQACVQPHFIAERGDRYLADVEPRLHPDLYRLRTLREAGIPMAGGSDAPYGSADPWQAMAAAVSRCTLSGSHIGPDEALTPEEALALYLADPLDLSRVRRISAGEPADFCLLGLPWSEARSRLSCADVAATICAGRLVYQRVDQTPFERLARADAAP
ncbi:MULTISPECIES: amidohydrolase family protein [unclassified Novosphingobium]|uniref:amidohydrolase family protein n=1 Tax=unclassified Novosphingobium TaxID=2644732 RepID=UPI00135CB5DD|nr:MULTISPECIES: amidohydrolase family protein [unclassified Novosphingobium]